MIVAEKMTFKQWALATLLWFVCAIWQVAELPGGQNLECSAILAPLIGGAISLISSAISSAQANKASKERGAALDNAWSQYQDWYQDEMSANILDRADTLSMLRRYREWQEEQAKKFQNNAIKSGASEEAKVAYAQQANKGYADAISQIAGYGARRKDQLSRDFAGARYDYMTKRADMAAEGAQSAANAVAGAGGIIGDIIGGMDWGGSKKTSTPAVNDFVGYDESDLFSHYADLDQM